MVVYLVSSGSASDFGIEEIFSGVLYITIKSRDYDIEVVEVDKESQCH